MLHYGVSPPSRAVVIDVQEPSVHIVNCEEAKTFVFLNNRQSGNPVKA